MAGTEKARREVAQNEVRKMTTKCFISLLRLLVFIPRVIRSH